MTPVPFLVAPLDGEFLAAGLFDHHATPDPSTQLAFTGAEVYGKGGHRGYDFATPVGTPVRAAAGGRVVAAGDQGRAFCKGRWVEQNVLIRLEHGAQADGQRYQTLYLHLSEVSVKEGDLVTPGQAIGLTGNTGCSSGPHLHFGVIRFSVTADRGNLVDPFGWSGGGVDPYRHASGRLWIDGEAPVVRRWTIPRRAPTGLGFRRLSGTDLLDPLNGEWVEIGVGPTATAGVSLAGLSVADRTGNRLALPDQVLAPGTWVRVWTTSPTGAPDVARAPGPHGPFAGSPAGELSWARTAEVWDDTGDCARLLDAQGTEVAALAFGPVGSGACADPGAPILEDE